MENGYVVYDGSKGTMLMQYGLEGCAEEWNLSHSDSVYNVLRSYAEAGSAYIQTNTFAANVFALAKYGLAEKQEAIIRTGVQLARRAAADTGAAVAFSAGPIGRMMLPSGDLSFDEAYRMFYDMVEIALKAGADIIHFETFTDLYELKAAVFAAKDCIRAHFGGIVCGEDGASVPAGSFGRQQPLPLIFATLAFEENGRTMMGDQPGACAAHLTHWGVSAVGANCSFGAERMLPVIQEMRRNTHLPIIAKPNCGLPEIIEGKTVYTQTPEDFAAACEALAEAGAVILGGCCGTSAAHIAALSARIAQLRPQTRADTDPGAGKKVDKNEPVLSVQPPDYEEDTLLDLAYELQEQAPPVIALWCGPSGAKTEMLRTEQYITAVDVLGRITGARILVGAAQLHVLEEILRKSRGTPGIWSACPRMNWLPEAIKNRLCSEYGCDV